MHDFVRNLLTEWRKLKLPFENATILIAVSGGADSVSLAAALSELQRAKKLNLNFIVANFNHKLRGADADADTDFVEQLAKKLNFKFIGGAWKKINSQKDNLEQSARDARYEFLRETAERENAFAVLTAHTLNDQAETLLLNLIRGSGVQGLGAMRTIRKLNNGKRKAESGNFDQSEILLVRPLLSWAKREETESFTVKRKIEFCQDSMNADEKFSRVKVRKKIIPLLRELNPKVVETLARTAFLLQTETQKNTFENAHPAAELTVRDLQSLSESEFYLKLRSWLKAKRDSLRQIDSKHIEAIGRLVLSRKSGRKVELPNGEAVIKKAGKLIFEKSKVEKSRSGN